MRVRPIGQMMSNLCLGSCIGVALFCLCVLFFSDTLHLCNDAREQKETEMDYIESLHCELDGCYRDLDHYESIGHQSRIEEVERVIASIKKQIEEAA